MNNQPVRTEGRKNDDDKLRFDLIPPKSLEQLAEVYTIGAKKYDDRNWEKGLRWGRVFAAMMRHAWRWMGGEKLDPSDGQHHLASVAWCAFTLMEFERTHKELDDRSKDGAFNFRAEFSKKVTEWREKMEEKAPLPKPLKFTLFRNWDSWGPPKQQPKKSDPPNHVCYSAAEGYAACEPNSTDLCICYYCGAERKAR